MNVKAKVAQVISLNVVIWFAMLTVFAGVIGCAAGVYMVLSGPLPDFTAAFIAGGGLIGLVVIVLAIVLPIVSGGQKRAAKPAEREARHSPDNFLEQQVRPVLGDQATNWAKNNTGIAVAGALTAGVVIAASPRLRALLLGAAGPIFTRKAMQTVSDLTDNG